MPPMPGAKLPTTNAPGHQHLLTTPRIANRDRQKVADMVKRRMSTRYVNSGEATDVPSIPVMPELGHLPGSLVRKGQAGAVGVGGIGVGAGGQDGQGGELDVDLDAFRDVGFKAEICA